jgi:hypothetical protein
LGSLGTNTLAYLSRASMTKKKSFSNWTFSHFKCYTLMVFWQLLMTNTLAFLSRASMTKKKSFSTWTFSHFRCLTLRPFWVHLGQTLYLICYKRGWLRKKVLSLEHLVIFLSPKIVFKWPKNTEGIWRFFWKWTTILFISNS